MWTWCRRSCWPRSQGVGVVVDYTDTTMTTETLLENFERLLTDFKGTIRWKNVLGCVYTLKSSNLKIWKPPYLKKKLNVCVVNNYTLVHKHVIFEFCSRISLQSRKNSWNRFRLSFGTQVESFKQKKWLNISWPCPFKGQLLKGQCQEIFDHFPVWKKWSKFRHTVPLF